MRALTLTQPWATLVALGRKQIETRSWRTKYRGPVAIHAAKAFPGECAVLCDREPFASALGLSWSALPLGAIVAIGELVDCRRFDERSHEPGWQWMHQKAIAPASIVVRSRELAFGDFSAGRFGWLILGVHALAVPIRCRGSLGLWEVRFQPEEMEVARHLPTGGLCIRSRSEPEE